VLTANQLFCQRSAAWHAGRISERFVLRPLSGARPVVVNAGQSADLGAVAGVRADVTPHWPTRHVAVASGKAVESTFELLAGWDPAGEGMADSEYARSTSSDFDAVANVYRLWLLNENGALGGEAFDLTSLFGQSRAIGPQALAFADCLTLDEAGRRLPAVVDVSIDAGQNWSRYSGPARVLRDRAGVYIDDDLLPADYLAAAKVSEARIRVTATLTCPLPQELVRWSGNAFAGQYRTATHRLDDVFALRQVLASSKFADDVAGGLRKADERDDRTAMESWLSRLASRPDGETATRLISTAGLALGLRIGDRLAGESGGPMWLQCVEHDWRAGGTRLTWRIG
jgi:hypothetical protein